MNAGKFWFECLNRKKNVMLDKAIRNMNANVCEQEKRELEDRYRNEPLLPPLFFIHCMVESEYTHTHTRMHSHMLIDTCHETGADQIFFHCHI